MIANVVFYLFTLWSEVPSVPSKHNRLREGIMYSKEHTFCPLIDEIDFKISTDGDFEVHLEGIYCAGDTIRVLYPSSGWNKTSISRYLPFHQIPAFSLPQNCHWQKISPPSSKRVFNWFPGQGRILFRKLEAKRGGKRIYLHPTSAKLLLTFNLFLQEMESYILTTVNRGAEERGVIRPRSDSSTSSLSALIGSPRTQSAPSDILPLLLKTESSTHRPRAMSPLMTTDHSECHTMFGLRHDESHVTISQVQYILKKWCFSIVLHHVEY